MNLYCNMILENSDRELSTQELHRLCKNRTLSRVKLAIIFTNVVDTWDEIIGVIIAVTTR